MSYGKMLKYSFIEVAWLKIIAIEIRINVVVSQFLGAKFLEILIAIVCLWVDSMSPAAAPGAIGSHTTTTTIWTSIAAKVGMGPKPLHFYFILGLGIYWLCL